MHAVVAVPKEVKDMEERVSMQPDGVSTGKRLGFQHHDVQPDTVTMAKGITSGYQQLGATAVERGLYERFGEDDEYGRLRHISTFGGHPAACAVAVKNMEIMEEEDLVERAAETGAWFWERPAALEEIPGVGQVRGRGMIYGIELVEDSASKRPASAERTTSVVARCRERGLIVGKNFDTVPGFDIVITLCPPPNVNAEGVDFIVRVLEESLSGGADAGRPQRPPTA